MPIDIRLGRVQYDPGSLTSFITACMDVVQREFPSGSHESSRLKSIQVRKRLDAAIAALIGEHKDQLHHTMREARLTGINDSLEERLCNYSELLAERCMASYNIGTRLKFILDASGVDQKMGRHVIGRVIKKYYSREIANTEPKEDESEQIALKKEARAFKMGLMGIPRASILEQNHWLRCKNVLQIMHEEETDVLATNALTRHPSQDELMSIEEFDAQFSD